MASPRRRARTCSLFFLLVCVLGYISCSQSATAEVTCGSVIKLVHERTKFRLHSHEVAYGSGSGQQSVTGFPTGDDSNSYWVVRGSLAAPCRQGEVIQNGAIVRLQHQTTRRWLHSHHHASPLTNNWEVSGFGNDGQTDTGDNWKLELEGRAKVWAMNGKFRLQHVDTGSYLHSHDKKYGRPIAGQQEVCAYPKKNSDNLWTAGEGVYFSKTASK